MAQRAVLPLLCLFFFFNDTATTEIYTLSLHDALPISSSRRRGWRARGRRRPARAWRSEEHTSELQSLAYLVCRLLLEKTQKTTNQSPPTGARKMTTTHAAQGAAM